MKTLLEKAKERKAQSPQNMFCEEEIELSLAYIKGEISLSQVCIALGKEKKHTTGYYFICRALRQHFSNK